MDKRDLYKKGGGLGHEHSEVLKLDSWKLAKITKEVGLPTVSCLLP